MDTDLTSYKNLYISSARENVAAIKQALLQMQKAVAQAEIETLFIKSHSLKGQSMTMGYTGIAKSCLAIERFMREVKEGKRTVTPQDVAMIQTAISQIEASILEVEKTNHELALSALITQLEGSLKVKV